ncbi:MAG TPA: AsmA-like C-terminal region-containing protein [Bryobacteraceae bacterium]|nr:AsmA-like C-terminal region-containing protein [Bryobacteraceae bacterium]
MSKRTKYVLAGAAVVIVAGLVGGYFAALKMARRFEPMLRAQAVQYLEDHFHTQVELQALHINRPKMSALQILLRHGRGAIVGVEGDGLSMRLRGDPTRPPLFTIQKVYFAVDLGVLTEPRKFVNLVLIDGMQINVPPKGERGNWMSGEKPKFQVMIHNVQIKNAVLSLLPADPTRPPLRFHIAQLRLQSVAANTAAIYNADLMIPKPPGIVKSTGNFGPWNADEPGDTPLNGNYTFDKADLGIFSGISGTLASNGTFDGALDSVKVTGTAYVPNFELKSAGNPVPLTTTFEALVDGTNGNTVLQPVRATLGHTNFTTTGAVIKHEEYSKRSITLKVSMPHGDMRDLLRLAMKGPPFMQGFIHMNASIDIPPLTAKVKQKLRLDGTFDLSDAKFLKSTIQDQVDQLSRRGQGQPKNQEIDEVVSNMQGSFHLENQVMTFQSLAFTVPGADVSISGTYSMAQDQLDFHGALKLNAHLSDTMTGWKRWLLKPADPFFAKNGAGTFLKIKIEGNAQHPKFGLDR